ncbi:MAG TPA: hypothetical protein VL523_16925 [Terriglobia bacterium]|nr:hypothetical protein [Terriglobia bacterium]
MRNAKILVPVALVAMMAACGPVEWLNPCYKDGDVTFDPALVGRWSDPDGTSVLQLKDAGDEAYQVVYTEVQSDGGRQESKFDGHLVRLGAFLFLDLLPQPASANPGVYPFTVNPSEGETGVQPHVAEVGDGLYAGFVRVPQASPANDGSSYELHLTQAHWVFRVWLDGDTLRLADLSEDWFKGAVDQGRVEMGQEEVNDTLVLTASTTELRAFLQEHGGDEGAFPEPEEGWSRQK